MILSGRARGTGARPSQLYRRTTSLSRTRIGTRVRRSMLRVAISALGWFGLGRWPIVALPTVSPWWRLRRWWLLCLVRSTLLLRIRIQRAAEERCTCPQPCWQCQRHSEHEHIENPKLRLVQRSYLWLFCCYIDLLHDACLRRALVAASVTAVRSSYALYKSNPDAKSLCFVYK
jgi:hypothetical protein